VIPLLDESLYFGFRFVCAFLERNILHLFSFCVELFLTVPRVNSSRVGCVTLAVRREVR